MKNLQVIIKDWLPPVMFRWVRNITAPLRKGIHFHGDFATWEEAAAQCTGYDAEGILAKVLDATLKVKRGEAAYERDSVLFDQIEYAWPVLAGLMCAAARNGGRLNVLDFGGALGSSYFQNRKFLQTLPEFRWNIVEQAHYVEAGQLHIQGEHLHFFKSIKECLNENQPNVILLSSVLQYIADPYSLLMELLELQASTIILDRTCYLHNGTKELVKIQHVPSSIYSAEYPCWFFIEENMLNIITNQGYKILEAFDSIDKLDSTVYWKGHIFERQAND